MGGLSFIGNAPLLNVNNEKVTNKNDVVKILMNFSL